MFNKYFFLLIIFSFCLACSRSNNPDKFQKAGAFVLKTSPDSSQGYSVLDDAYTNTDAMLDVRLSDFNYQADTVLIRASGPDRGGLILGTGNEAPDYAYALCWRLKIAVVTSPLQFWLLCRDNAHYCKLMLDSLRVQKSFNGQDSIWVCSGYFQYVLNLEEKQREF